MSNKLNQLQMKPFNKSIKELILKLNEEVNSKIPTINKGGCGVFALLLGEKLEAMGFLVEYHYLVRNKSSIVTIIESVNNNDARTINCASWSHVVLKVNNRYYIDSEIITKKQSELINNFTVFTYHFTPSVPKYLLKTHVSLPNTWNSKFNRRKEIPKITKLLNKYLEV